MVTVSDMGRRQCPAPLLGYQSTRAKHKAWPRGATRNQARARVNVSPADHPAVGLTPNQSAASPCVTAASRRIPRWRSPP